MKINILAGTGTGTTKLSAFDSALFNAGVSNYNLIKLSSVIPPKSQLLLDQPMASNNWGDKLYVVLAEKRVATPGQQACAGIGWVQDKKTGQGLFVEHSGLNKLQVEEDILNSLNDLMKNRSVKSLPVSMKLSSISCTNKPVCALVIAVYENEGWKND